MKKNHNNCDSTDKIKLVQIYIVSRKNIAWEQLSQGKIEKHNIR